MIPSGEVEIRLWRETDSVKELTALLHLAYRRLADLGFRFVATHQTPDVTRERLKGATCWVAVLEEQIIGTLCLYPADPAQSCEWYAREGVWRFGQFAVHPEYQRHGIGARLLTLAEQTARQAGAKELALDTAESATHLIDHYSARGFRQVGYAQWGSTNYRSVIMSKRLDCESAADA